MNLNPYIILYIMTFFWTNNKLFLSKWCKNGFAHLSGLKEKKKRYKKLEEHKTLQVEKN
jgi:hypothetical protein